MSFLTRTHSTLRALPAATTPIIRSFSTTPAQRLARMTVVGRLADNPDIVSTSTGQDVIRYALGTSHGPKDNRQTSWWRVACFAQEGPLRDLVMGLGKGSLVYLEGDCSMNKFTGKDGSEQSALSIVQRNIEILDKRNSESPSEGQ